MKKFYLALGIVTMIGILGFLVILNNSQLQESSNLEKTNETSFQENQNASPQTNGISLDELAKHNSKEDCWVVYKEKVYDVSEFIPNHPGGENAISRQCGTTNFEEAFQKKHGTSKADLFMTVTTYKGEFSN